MRSVRSEMKWVGMFTRIMAAWPCRPGRLTSRFCHRGSPVSGLTGASIAAGERTVTSGQVRRVGLGGRCGQVGGDALEGLAVGGGQRPVSSLKDDGGLAQAAAVGEVLGQCLLAPAAGGVGGEQLGFGRLAGVFGRDQQRQQRRRGNPGGHDDPTGPIDPVAKTCSLWQSSVRFAWRAAGGPMRYLSFNSMPAWRQVSMS